MTTIDQETRDRPAIADGARPLRAAPPFGFEACSSEPSSGVIPWRPVPTKLVSKLGPSLKPLTLPRRPATSVCWKMMTKGLVSSTVFCSSLYISARLAAVLLEQRRLGLLRQFRNVPGIAPGERLVLAVVGIVRIGW